MPLPKTTVAAGWENYGMNMNAIDITKLAPGPANPLSTTTFDHVLSRLQSLTPPSQEGMKQEQEQYRRFQAAAAAAARNSSPSNHQHNNNNNNQHGNSNGSGRGGLKDVGDEGGAIIDNFAPRRNMHDLSPTSSMSSSDASHSSQTPSPTLVANQQLASTQQQQAAFSATRSRVVRLYNLPSMADSFLARVFLPNNNLQIPIPITLWELKDEFLSGRRDSVWAVFRTHEEASAALTLSGVRAMSVATALESDLEPFQKLHRVLLANPASSASSSSPALPPLGARESNNNTLDVLPQPHSAPSSASSFNISSTTTTNSSSSTINTTTLAASLSANTPRGLRVSSSLSDLHPAYNRNGMHMGESMAMAMNMNTSGMSTGPMSMSIHMGGTGMGISTGTGMGHREYTLSSNPPNPKTSFRLGDWICTQSKCAAHNFGRNLACIGCGCPRGANGNANGYGIGSSSSSSSMGAGGSAAGQGQGQGQPHQIWASQPHQHQQQQANQHHDQRQMQHQQYQQHQQQFSPLLQRGAGGPSPPRFASASGSGNGNGNANANVNGGMNGTGNGVTTYYSSSAPAQSVQTRHQQQQMIMQSGINGNGGASGNGASVNVNAHSIGNAHSNAHSNANFNANASANSNNFSNNKAPVHLYAQPNSNALGMGPPLPPSMQRGQQGDNAVLGPGHGAGVGAGMGSYAQRDLSALHHAQTQTQVQHHAQTQQHHAQTQQHHAQFPPRAHESLANINTNLNSNHSNGSSSGASKSSSSSSASGSAHPLLTPSGRAFAVGGKVQNVSSDPLSPCVMYWPDNEPFPEQGQIRPNCLAGIAPPILNTGNRGPISHQPGDWICQKCNYLNWRRRKVCQTCLPYAEGNGDSISAAVQAERITLLTSVLSQTHMGGAAAAAGANVGGGGGGGGVQHHHQQQQQQHGSLTRAHSLTPPLTRSPFIDLTQTSHGQMMQAHAHREQQQQQQQQQQHQQRSVHRSQSHFALGQQYAGQHLHQQQQHYTASSPIYQTSGHRQPSPLPPSPIFATGPRGRAQTQPQSQQQQLLNVVNGQSGSGSGSGTPVVGLGGKVQAPAPLLPSFLQDIVQSPALSPTSTTTSSADLSSIEEYDEIQQEQLQQQQQQQRNAVFPRARGDSGSSASDASLLSSSPIANIWRLDGEESKSLSAFPLPNHQELVGARTGSAEKLYV